MAAMTLLDEVKIDHDNIRDLFARFKEAHAKQDEMLMSDVSNTIVREAAVHSDAEEMSVYKLMDKYGMSSVADHDRQEHHQVKVAMANVDTESPQSIGIDPYAKLVNEATALFLHHAEEEEQEQFPKLQKMLEKDEELGAIKDFLKARKMAPPRPHPSAPQSGGIAQKLAGASAKLTDKPVDKMRDYAPLKYVHSDSTP